MANSCDVSLSLSARDVGLFISNCWGLFVARVKWMVLMPVIFEVMDKWMRMSRSIELKVMGKLFPVCWYCSTPYIILTNYFHPVTTTAVQQRAAFHSDNATQHRLQKPQSQPPNKGLKNAAAYKALKRDAHKSASKSGQPLSVRNDLTIILSFFMYPIKGGSANKVCVALFCYVILYLNNFSSSQFHSYRWVQPISRWHWWLRSTMLSRICLITPGRHMYKVRHIKILKFPVSMCKVFFIYPRPF